MSTGSSDIEPVPRQVQTPRRKSKEQAIKDVIVVIGFFMMTMCFSLLLVTNVQDWDEGRQIRVSIISSVGLCLCIIFFLIYIYSRTKNVRSKWCRPETPEENSQNVSFMVLSEIC